VYDTKNWRGNQLQSALSGRFPQEAIVAKHLPPLERLDPGEAWQPWRPDATLPWDLRWAGHLYRRAAFGGTLDELRQAVKDGLPATLERLLAGDPAAASYAPLLADTGASIAKSGDESALRGWWVYAMLYGGHPLREKMTLFWHNHFATSNTKVRSLDLMFGQNQTLRRHALVKFRPLLADISRDPAMLVWLDSNRNVKGQANENYAREVMELFTLGVGHYTEADIREAARAFTGWHTDGERFTFAPRFHDDGEKTVLGRRGPWDGTDVQRIILDQPASALFLARKLYRFFISETANPPDALLEPLAERFRHSDYDIGDLVATMLRSRHFFSDYAYRQRVKCPVEYVLGVVRAVRPAVAPRELVQPLEQMGQVLFAPPNVKGWTGGKNWLNSATVLARQNFAQAMLAGPTPPAPPKGSADAKPPSNVAPDPDTPLRVGIVDNPAAHEPEKADDITALVTREHVTEPAAAVNLLADLLLQGDITEETQKKMLAFFAEGKPEKAAWQQRVRETAHALMTLPEYTLA
jgi:hypothetical protein